MPALRQTLSGLRPSVRLSRLLRSATARLTRHGPVAGPDLSLAAAEAAPAAAAPAGPGTMAAAKAEWADRLWEEGCLLPGGLAEIQRLAGLMPLSPATTMLLLGRDAGGAAAAIATQRGAWVAAHQHDPLLAERMAARLRPLGRRVGVEPWSPAAPAFRSRYHHHALALEPLGCGAAPEALLPALAVALKPAGQLVLLEVVLADAAAARAQGAGFDRWLALETRSALPPARAAIEAGLQAAGFQLHVTEDVGRRHAVAVTEGWARLIDGLRRGERLASRIAAAALIAEAELWLLRQRLVTGGAIGLLRWHATLRS